MPHQSIIKPTIPHCFVQCRNRTRSKKKQRIAGWGGIIKIKMDRQRMGYIIIPHHSSLRRRSVYISSRTKITRITSPVYIYFINSSRKRTGAIGSPRRNHFGGVDASEPRKHLNEELVSLSLNPFEIFSAYVRTLPLPRFTSAESLAPGYRKSQSVCASGWGRGGEGGRIARVERNFIPLIF